MLAGGTKVKESLIVDPVTPPPHPTPPHPTSTVGQETYNNLKHS